MFEMNKYVYFLDVNITFSMYYNMNGRHVNTLRVYLKKTKTAEKTEIIKESGNQGRSWMFFNRTVVIDGKTRVISIILFSFVPDRYIVHILSLHKDTYPLTIAKLVISK